MTPSHDMILRKAAHYWREGQRVSARQTLAIALTELPRDTMLLGFAGLLACQDDDPVEGALLLRRALAIDPTDQASRINLIHALIATGALDEAVAESAGMDASNPRVARALGYIAQQQHRHDDAALFYGIVVTAAPNDAQSWNNLGNARSATGDLSGAMTAFRQAVSLHPTDPVPHVNASKALAKGEQHRARLSWMRQAAQAFPLDRNVQVEAGLAEAAERHFAAAETAFRKAITIAPDDAEAYIELGLLLENLNRVDDLRSLVELALFNGVRAEEIALIAAWLARREGRWADAAQHAHQVSDSVIPLRRHHLRADIADRMENSAMAFAEFTRMNDAARALAPPLQRPTYRDQVFHEFALIADEGRRVIGPAATSTTPASPIFIVGFPRSGTTLLDTLLMNDPRFHVLEEMPMLPEVESEARQQDGVLRADADSLRRRYFELVAQIAPAPVGTTIVDKFPLHMARLPLLHRLFPDAKIILVERHPCDVVLSCFMANFQLNHAMRHFTSLQEAAELYDTVFESFEQSMALLPIDLHRVRYERLVDDPETEMRALMRFLGRSWSSAVLDNQASAARREHIRTASYSQVTEPIYRRAAGRWERYRSEMEEVLPILAPWCDRLGYAIGEPD